MDAEPALHPEAQAILERILASGEPPLETLTPGEARRIADERVIRTAGKGAEVGTIEEHALTVDGRPVALRIYSPEAVTSAPQPVLVYVHGGGFVVGNLDTIDSTCRDLTAMIGCKVASIGYSLAPEYRFPAAVEDSYGAIAWMLRHAAELAIDPGRMALAGESSGGMIVALLAQMANRSGDFAPRLQAMVYPMLDLKPASESYRRLETSSFLSGRKMRWFIDHAVPDAEDVDPGLASPWRASDLDGLPPALIITAEVDPLVDEGMAYAERLKAAGVPTRAECYAGWPHGFLYWAGTEAQRRALEAVAAETRKALGL